MVLPFQDHQILLSVLLLSLPEPFLKGKILWPHGEMGMDNYIVLSQIRVERRGILCHGLFHCDHWFVFLIFHLYESGRLLAGHIIRGNNGSNVIPIEPDAPVQKLSVPDILVGGLHTPRMTGCGKLVIRHIKTGDDFHNARHLKGVLKVKPLNKPIGNGGMDHPGAQAVPWFQIRCVLCLSCDFCVSVNTGNAFTYYIIHDKSVLFSIFLPL